MTYAKSGLISRILLAAVVVAALACYPAFTLAQTTPGLEGSWEGVISGKAAKLRVILRVSKSADGVYIGSLVSPDQGGATIPIDRIEVEGDKVNLQVSAVHGSFEGNMNAERRKITGTWSQGNAVPLELTRTSDAPQSQTSSGAPRPAPNPFGLPLDLQVPFSPAIVSGGGKRHLVYELHITNLSVQEMRLDRVEVLGGDAALARYEGAELNAMLMQPGKPGLEDNRVLGPGLRAISFLWITLSDGTEPPAHLRHRITSGSETVEGAAAPVRNEAPIVLSPPVQGSNWMAGNGPSNFSIHRRALFPIDGKAQCAQRLAIDWVRLGPDKKSFAGDQTLNTSYFAYGAEALAVADGVVTATKDGIPENAPGAASRAVAITRETIGGNFVVLALGAGRYAFFAHLQPGSLRVAPGDRIRRGQVLGLVGNSGNSTEPHLHFQLSDGESPLGSDGIPYVLESYELLSGHAPGPRRSELPLQNDVVSFTESR